VNVRSNRELICAARLSRFVQDEAGRTVARAVTTKYAVIKPANTFGSVGLLRNARSEAVAPITIMAQNEQQPRASVNRAALLH
jgi:hypothetical protein